MRHIFFVLLPQVVQGSRVCNETAWQAAQYLQSRIPLRMSREELQAAFNLTRAFVSQK